MRRIEHIEQLAALLVVLVGAALLAFGATNLAAGTAAGGALSIANFYLLRKLARGLLRATHPPTQLLLGLLMATKFLVMGAALYVMIRYVRLDAIGMLVGVSLVVLSILIGGFKFATVASDPAGSEQE
jgi:hypothetical protein